MVCSTPALWKRTPVHLKGFRRPAIRTLRRAQDSIHPTATLPGVPVPHNQPKAGIFPDSAWTSNLMNVPILALYNKVGLKAGRLEEGSGDQSRNVLLHRLLEKGTPCFRAWSVRERCMNENSKPVLSFHDQVPGIVVAKQKRSRNAQNVLPLLPADPSKLLEDRRPNMRTNAVRYTPPATAYWQHSIYTYNQSTMKPLPVTTLNTTKVLRAFFMRTPKKMDSVFPSLQTPQSRHRSVIRTYLLDRTSTAHTDLHPSLMGKISMNGRHGFLLPWRKMSATISRTSYKHFASGDVGINVFLYDRRLESLKQARALVWKRLMKLIASCQIDKSSRWKQR